MADKEQITALKTAAQNLRNELEKVDDYELLWHMVSIMGQMTEKAQDRAWNLYVEKHPEEVEATLKRAMGQ